MAKQIIDVGSKANDGSGDSLREAGLKINANFTEVYTALGGQSGSLSVVSKLTGANGLIVSSPTGDITLTNRIATPTQLGVIKVGNNLSINSEGVLSANAGAYTLPTATGSVLGGVKIGSNITISNGVISVAAPFSGSYNDLTNKPTIPTNTNQLTNGAGFLVASDISGKQATLVSGTNIKTINGTSLLGSGDITISGGGANTGDITFNDSDIGSETSGNFVNLDVDGEEWMRLGTSGSENVQIITGYDGEDTKTWEFNNDGSLYMPEGGAIWLSYGYIDQDTDFDDNALRISGGEGVTIKTSEDGTTWRFNNDGSLQIPGDIKSDGNINIDINLEDSTLRRWQFGEDGNLTLPEGGDIVDINGNSVISSLLVITPEDYEVQDVRTLAFTGAGVSVTKIDDITTVTIEGGGDSSYTPEETDHWNSPTVNTVQAALDELAAKVAALENFEIDGGNAYTPPQGELLIDGNGA